MNKPFESKSNQPFESFNSGKSSNPSKSNHLLTSTEPHPTTTSTQTDHTCSLSDIKINMAKHELSIALENLIEKINLSKNEVNVQQEASTERICSIEFLKEHSEKYRKILKDDDEHSKLEQEFSMLYNWFQVNEIVIEDLEDEEQMEPKITMDMEINQMRDCILKYIEPICSNGFSSLGTYPDIKHVIELVEPKPFRDKMRQIPHAKRKDFNILLKELLDAGIIVASNSQYSSQPHVILKPDGTIRFTVDYKHLNSMTVKDNHPLPVIDDLFKDMVGCTFFSKKDLDSGYFQVELDELSRKYTAFSCELGLFHWTKMPQGLKNSGATFQKMMNKILAPVIGRTTHCYLDDIIIFSKTAAQHKLDIEEVVELLKAAQLKIKLKKCSYFQREIEFLGHHIANGKISPTKSKIEALFRYNQPTTLKQLFSFLGLASYYRKFIEQFTKLAHALYKCCEENILNKGKTIGPKSVRNHLMAYGHT